MSFPGSKTGRLADAVASRCDRLVHPAVASGERPGHRRIIGLMLALPFLAAFAAATGLNAELGFAGGLAVVCAVFGAAWTGALAVAWTGARGFVEIMAAMLATAFCAVTIAAAGGLLSPMAAIALALPVEAWWLRRDRRALAAGLGAAGIALAVQPWLASPFVGAAPSPVHWLVPLAYAGVALFRLSLDRPVSAPKQIGSDLDAAASLARALIVKLTLSGEAQDASRSSVDILGIAPEMLLANGFFDRLHVSDRIAYLSALADLRAAPGTRKVEARLRHAVTADVHPAPQFGWFDIELTRLAEDADMVTALARPIDELVALRAALASERDRADGTEFAKSRVLASVSHELRTPLNAIIGFSDVLLHEMFGPFSDARQKEYVTMVRDAGDHLLSVVNSILDVSKIESGAFTTTIEPFRFADAVEMSTAMVSRAAAAKGLKLSTKLAMGIGDVRGDRRAVQQMLINLLSNAVKFTPDTGEIEIGARRIGTRLHFWVSDNGIGISEKDLERIGTPFTQIRNDYTRPSDGTGLGLALVKGLAALHQGTMSIESEPGNGTTVTITLPIEGPSHHQPAQIVSMVASAPTGEDHGIYRKTA